MDYVQYYYEQWRRFERDHPRYAWAIKRIARGISDRIAAASREGFSKYFTGPSDETKKHRARRAGRFLHKQGLLPSAKQQVKKSYYEDVAVKDDFRGQVYDKKYIAGQSRYGHGAYEYLPRYDRVERFTFDSVDMPGLSNYNNVEVTWRARRESRGHKRRRLRNIYQARRAALDEVGPIAVQRGPTATTLTAGASAQSMNFIRPLYSFYGDNASGNDDLFDIATAVIAEEVDTGGVNFTDFHFQSAKQTNELVNLATSSVYIDAWYWFAKADMPYAQLSTMNGMPDQLGALGVMTDVTIGVTPFDMPYLIAHATFYKKEQYLLTPGQTVTVELLDKKPKTLRGSKFQGVSAGSQVGISGWTKGIMYVICGAAGAANTADAASVRLVTTNTYNLKWIPTDALQEQDGGVM